MAPTPRPVLPDYGGACLDGVVSALSARPGSGRPGWLPAPAREADQVVLLVLDGLGWEQLQERPALAPVLSSMEGGPITTVVPSTTATALTSLTTASPPARHGVVGYRVRLDGDVVLNVLRWRSGEDPPAIEPAQLCAVAPFGGAAPPVVTRAEFARSGFSAVHLAGSPLVGWRVPSTLLVQVRRLLAAGERFVYAYYDGVDKVAHEFGFGEAYDAELVAADRLVADLIDALPTGAAAVVVSDHGQVEVGEQVVALDPAVAPFVEMLSGEGRFRWLHASAGRVGELESAVRARYADDAWVATRQQAVEQGWFGGRLSPEVAARLGDVVIAPHRPMAVLDPADTGEMKLRCRHGSLTAAEMWVPLLAASG